MRHPRRAATERRGGGRSSRRCAEVYVRRCRWRASPSALVFLGLALLCAIDHGWVALTPNASQSGFVKKVLLVSFERDVSLVSFENNGTVLDVPIPIIHPPWDKIDPTSIVGQGLCLEGQNEGTV